MKKFFLYSISMGKDSFDVLTHTAKRRLGERELALCENKADADYVVTFAVDECLKNDRYTINAKDGKIGLTAANDCSLHAAFGRFLLESRFDGRGGFKAFEGKIDFTPKDMLRGMYFATHFYNFYHSAPLEEVYEVIEDLALVGCNSLLVWFDMHHYDSMVDEGAQVLVKRLRAILKYANLIGISGSLTMLGNEAFKSSPAELRAEWEPQGGYTKPPHDHYHVEICSSKEGGIEEILRERREMLEHFKDIDIDYICYWPYDQGGCTCMKCQPWGANGFLKLLPHFKGLINEFFPNAKIILSTWFFGRFYPGEWDDFYPKMTDGSLNGVNYIMSFFYDGKLPECIEKNGLPEGVKFIDFPEISMHFCTPWGGFASHLVSFLDRTNEGSGKLYSGGFPYSEGIFEDANKFCTQTYYSGLYEKATDALRAYIDFEYCLDGEELDEMVDAIAATETGLWRRMTKDGESTRYTIVNPSEVERVYRVFTRYNAKLPDKIRKSYKFRLFYLRALIDRELVSCDGYPLRSEVCQKALQEVNDIYYASENTHVWVKPPVGI